MKRFCFFALISLLITGCNSKTEDTLSIDKIMNEQEYIVIDVRTKEEYAESHVIDAINIPYDEIEEKINIDKETVIFVYCRSGNRSSIATKTLEKLGYAVYDLGSYANIDLEKE